jgi:hypothetical protein
MADLAFVTEVKPERAVVTEEVVARIGELTDGLAGRSSCRASSSCRARRSGARRWTWRGR